MPKKNPKRNPIHIERVIQKQARKELRVVARGVTQEEGNVGLEEARDSYAKFDVKEAISRFLDAFPELKGSRNDPMPQFGRYYGNPAELHFRKAFWEKHPRLWNHEKRLYPLPTILPQDPPRVCQFRINLAGANPPIWRRILIRDTDTLGDLHNAIQDAFGWEDYHYHDFEIIATVPEYDEQRVQGGIQGRLFEPDAAGEYDCREDNVKIRDILGALTEHYLRYTYDFGDYWVHYIWFEEILPPAVAGSIRLQGKGTACIGGERAAPPEDAGGMNGYEEKLRILKRRTHPRYAETREWMGDFNSEEMICEIATELDLGEVATRNQKVDAAITALVQERYHDAETLGEELYYEMPDRIRARDILAEALEGREKFAEIIEVMNPWVERNPNDWIAWSWLGDAYKGLRREQEAYAAYLSAIKIYPRAVPDRTFLLQIQARNPEVLRGTYVSPASFYERDEEKTWRNWFSFEVAWELHGILQDLYHMWAPPPFPQEQILPRAIQFGKVVAYDVRSEVALPARIRLNTESVKEVFPDTSEGFRASLAESIQQVISNVVKRCRSDESKWWQRLDQKCPRFDESR